MLTLLIVQKASQTKAEEDEKQSGSTSFLNFSFFKIDSKWRWLNDIGKEEAAKEFAILMEVASKRMRIRTYSTIGLRKESDFMIWTISDSIEKIQILASKIYSTVLGKYIEPSETYLSTSRKSIYSNKSTANFMTDEIPLKYNIVYPFIKSRDWYLLPYEKRKEMMDEHIAVGQKYPQIKLNTSYSFGIGDQDFMLAFETNNLLDFQDLIIKLRETRVSKYVVTDTPMIVCVYKDVEELIRSLG
jgi:chlorite dismutase